MLDRRLMASKRSSHERRNVTQPHRTYQDVALCYVGASAQIG